MLTFLIAFAAAAVASYFTYGAGEGGHWGWAILAALGAALAVIIPINLFVRRQLNAVVGAIQRDLLAMQEHIRAKATTLANRGQGSPKLVAQLEQEQVESIRGVMPQLDSLRKYRLWNPLVKSQADLMKAQLLYQIKDYDAARPLIEKAIVFDPSILCMKMILQWKKDPENIELIGKIFRKSIPRFKYEKGTLAYATYSWILVKQNKLTEAVTLLDEAKKKTEDPVIIQNWENLANRRLTRFSNAGLGESWYALGLEQPTPVRVSQQDRFGGRMRGGFRR